MMSPEEAYKYDATFQRVVDLMRAHLSVYEITPSELRQAAILAAAMHESQRVKPLFTRSYFPAKPWGGMEVFIDEAKDIPPAMFGGMEYDKWSGKNIVNRTVPIGFLPSDKNPEYDLKCICGWTNVTTKEMHSATCQHYNWNFYHPVTGLSKPEHCHIFRSSGYGYDVCNDCGMSDVYYNWAYNKKS